MIVDVHACPVSSSLVIRMQFVKTEIVVHSPTHPRARLGQQRFPGFEKYLWVFLYYAGCSLAWLTLLNLLPSSMQ